MRRTDDGVDRTPGNTPPVDDLAHRQRRLSFRNLLILAIAAAAVWGIAIAYAPEPPERCSILECMR